MMRETITTTPAGSVETIRAGEFWQTRVKNAFGHTILGPVLNRAPGKAELCHAHHVEASFKEPQEAQLTIRRMDGGFFGARLSVGVRHFQIGPQTYRTAPEAEWMAQQFLKGIREIAPLVRVRATKADGSALHD